jgi:hypothetical protein
VQLPRGPLASRAYFQRRASSRGSLEENSVDESRGTGTAPLASRAPNHIVAARAQESSVALSQLKELGEQAIVAVAASLARGGPIVRGQLIASRFYEALRRELKQSTIHDTKRAALIAASDRCERIAAASINPSTMLDELRKAIAVLQADEHSSAPPPPRARPVLRLIEGGLSKI